MAPPATLFSTERFLSAWLSVPHHNYNEKARLISLTLAPGVLLSGITDGCYAECGPHGLYAAPAAAWPTDRRLGIQLNETLVRHRLASLTWNVRFDHADLIARLSNETFERSSTQTHVLPITTSDYDVIFAGYSSTRRNEIRKSRRRGVRVRPAASRQDVERYCDLHRQLEVAKNFSTRYPTELLNALVELDDCLLLVAEVNDRIIAGGLFFIDGNSMFYWHGAADRSASEFSATPALIDAAVQHACASGMRSVNFGASVTDSLRFFKESFGAEARSNWTFLIRPQRSRAMIFADRVAQRLSWPRR